MCEAFMSGMFVWGRFLWDSRLRLSAERSRRRVRGRIFLRKPRFLWRSYGGATALAALVPSLHGSAVGVRTGIFFCYNFQQRAPKEFHTTMSSANHNLRIAGAFAALSMLALAVSCTGFFVNPTLTSLSVGPVTPTIETGTTGNTVQMTAFGTNNDGSTNTHPSVAWSISPTTGVATISTSGLVTSVAIGTATVTATSNQNPTILGTQTVTVTVGCVQSIQLSQTSGSVSGNNPTLSLTATATTCNGPFDVTSVATWTSSNTNLATVSAGTVTEVAGITTGGSVTITATIGNIVSNPPATITVTP